MAAGRRWIAAVALLAWALCAAVEVVDASSRSSALLGARRTPSEEEAHPLRTKIAVGKKTKPSKKPKQKHPFTSPVNFFIQERASKQLPGPGQHFQFGALQSWDKVQEVLDNTPDSKLMLLIRHGQALSNWLEETLGPDEWFGVETKCIYDDKNGTIYNVFDAELTELGQEQGRYLNSILDGGGWFAKMTGNRSVRAIVSPLSRCLQTSLLVSQNLPIERVSVEEHVRETLGEDTCDARRSVTDPDADHPYLKGPCDFEQGLRSKYPQFEFPIVGSSKKRAHNGGFGLISDEDVLWTKVREEQKDQTKRATRFLYDLFNYAPEQVVVVYTHSGFTRSVLLAVGREPYRPQNTELVPVIVVKRADYDDEDEEDDLEEEGEQQEQ